MKRFGMDTAELNDELDALRHIAGQRALQCTTSDQRCQSLLMVVQNLGRARDPKMRDDQKALSVQMAKLVLQGAERPQDATIDGPDQEVFVSALQAAKSPQ